MPCTLILLPPLLGWRPCPVYVVLGLEGRMLCPRATPSVPAPCVSICGTKSGLTSALPLTRPAERPADRLLPLYQVKRLLLNGVIFFSPVGVCRMYARSRLCRCTHMCVHVFGSQRPLPSVFLDQSSHYILRCVSHLNPELADWTNRMSQFALRIPQLCLWLRDYSQATSCNP